MPRPVARPFRGLFIFLGRYELQSRAYARSHSPAQADGANAERGPAAIRRELRNMLATSTPIEDFDDFHPPVPAPMEAPITPSASPNPAQKSPPIAWPARTSYHQPIDARAPTRRWYRLPKMFGGHHPGAV